MYYVRFLLLIIGLAFFLSVLLYVHLTDEDPNLFRVTMVLAVAVCGLGGIIWVVTSDRRFDREMTRLEEEIKRSDDAEGLGPEE